jgi:nucleotide-binding universal stress UspA family protein
MDTILINMSDSKWTTNALHEACTLARGENLQIVLLHLMPVQHLSWLGTDLAIQPMTPRQREQLNSCVQTAEDYGLSLILQPMQYTSFVEAIVQAADTLSARFVFTKAQPGLFKRWQESRLKQELAAHGHTWITDEGETSVNWTLAPAVTR